MLFSDPESAAPSVVSMHNIPYNNVQSYTPLPGQEKKDSRPIRTTLTIGHEMKHYDKGDGLPQ